MTRAQLMGWSLCQDTCDTAALVVSELVTNAIVHTASTQIVCELRDGDDLVRIAVRDEGCAPGEPHPAAQRPEEEHGRGLLLIESLCRSWGAQPAGLGLLVWADVPHTVLRTADVAPLPYPAGAGSADTPAPPARTAAFGAVDAPQRTTSGAGHADAPRRTAFGAGVDTAARSDLGWGAKKPPADGKDDEAQATARPGPPGATPEARGLDRGLA
ncbi:ATP-binding protein [Streptomyces graminofaciens]|uniref:ATP-binding protein n=1 Tax=Streptomyces graminofaciens TaxID=68212 RepID=UPI0025738742|nr:ATP-binding protein [Streptomyces graminofaciens]